MREIALHILDLIENSIRAQASIIAVSVEAMPEQDLLRIVIEDNGTGLKVSPEAALDPFYTTKSGKRTGLGLSLFRAAAESTGGRLTLGKSSLGGATGLDSPGGQPGSKVTARAPRSRSGSEDAGRGPGLKVTVEMGLTHVDRNPLGDLAGTLSSVVCTNPEIDFRFFLRTARRGAAGVGGQRECRINVFDLAGELGQDRCGGLAVAQKVMEKIRTELEACTALT